jgi:hypothetical protein
VLVDGRPWGEGELLDWSVERATLVDAGGRYDNRFRTFPLPDRPAPVTFAVLGDFGVGIVDGRLDGLRQHYFDDPAHRPWIEETLRGDGARWRIPFSHHPPFCAGPEHTNTTGMVRRLVPLFEEAGVRLVLVICRYASEPAIEIR